MRIDVHAHYFPHEYVDLLARQGRSVQIVIRPPGSSLDERIELLDRAGIDLQVLSAGPLQPYAEKLDDAVAGARMLNDILAAASRDHNGRYAALGSVPLPHTEATLAEMARCLDELGMLGISVGCSVNDRPLDDPSLEPFYAELDRRGAALFLHPLGVMTEYGLGDYGLAWMVGAPFEDTVAGLRLVLSGLTVRYPNVRVIVPHLGGALPYLLERLDYAAAGQRAHNPRALPIEENPSTLVKRLYLDTSSLHPMALRCAADSLGADHLMLGTDFPYLAGHRFEQCVTYIEASGLPAQSVRSILDETAVAILGLTPNA
ncbi:MAG: amidohydrolase [Chloroflexi bacterium]|nr:amidohydrolase [Chloroflexota bacterium]